MRNLKGIHFYIVCTIAFIASAYHLYTAVFGVFTPRLQRGFHLMFLLPIAFLLYPANKKSPKDRPSIVDYLFSLLVFFPSLYVVLENSRLEERWEFVTKVLPIEMLLGAILIVLIVELIRRAVAPALAIVVGGSLLYLLFGSYLPASIAHNGFPINRCIELLYLISDEGIFGMMTGISATYVAIFILFGSFLVKTGISDFFSDFTRAIAGNARGGPAKIAVISSSLFGTISGIAVANVFATGSFTIPLMKKRGYRPEFAGAVEAVASTGGQYMPPIMGAAAFIMAEMLSIPYIRIVAYASISAVLYYIAVFYTVDIEARKFNLLGEAKEDLPKKSEVLRKTYLLLPIVTLLYLLIIGYSPLYAGSWCIFISIFVALANIKVRNNIFKVFTDCMITGAKNTSMLAAALAGTGIIVAVITHTGIGLRFARLIIYLSGGNLILAMVLIAIGALILGTGVPTTAAYILSVLLGGRALIEMGVLPIAAHLFCFYFAIIACITPPVALCAYAASSIAKSNPVKTGFEAFKLGIAGFIIPFIFVFHPGLLLQGNLIEILFSIIMAIFVVFLVCSVIQNYFIDCYLNIFGSVFLSIVIILVMLKSIYYVLLGLLFFMFFLFRRKYFLKKKKI